MIQNDVFYKKLIHGFLLLVCLFGIIIRFYPDGQSLWLDELYSVSNTYCWGSFSKLFWGEMIFETNPPLYQTFLYFWVRLFGVSEYAVRFPSAVFGATSIIITLVSGEKIFGKDKALLLAALLSVSCASIRYSHEARSYSLLLMLTVILMMQSQKMIARYNTKTASNGLLFLTFLTGLFLCYTHYFGALIYFSSLFTLFLLLKPSRKKLVVLAFASLVAFAPWLTLNLIYYNPYKVSWISSHPWDTYLFQFRDFALSNWKLSGLIGFFVLIIAFLQTNHDTKNLLKVILYPLVTLIVAVIVVLCLNAMKPMIVMRYLIVFLPFVYFIISAVFSEQLSLKNTKSFQYTKNIPAILSFIMIIAMLYLSVNVFKKFEKADWRGSAHSIISIQNIDKVYCIGRPLSYWHYLRGSGIESKNVVPVNASKTSVISRPIPGTVSILWGAHNMKVYDVIKQYLIEHNYNIIEEQILLTNPESFVESRFIVFR